MGFPLLCRLQTPHWRRHSAGLDSWYASAQISMTGANFNLVTVRVELGEDDPEPEQHLDEVCPLLPWEVKEE